MDAVSGEGKHLVIIGGGPGGYPAAFHAADHGYQVTIINAEPRLGSLSATRLYPAIRN